LPGIHLTVRCIARTAATDIDQSIKRGQVVNSPVGSADVRVVSSGLLGIGFDVVGGVPVPGRKFPDSLVLGFSSLCFSSLDWVLVFDLI